MGGPECTQRHKTSCMVVSTEPVPTPDYPSGETLTTVTTKESEEGLLREEE